MQSPSSEHLAYTLSLYRHFLVFAVDLRCEYCISDTFLLLLLLLYDCNMRLRHLVSSGLEYRLPTATGYQLYPMSKLETERNDTTFSTRGYSVFASRQMNRRTKREQHISILPHRMKSVKFQSMGRPGKHTDAFGDANCRSSNAKFNETHNEFVASYPRVRRSSIGTQIEKYQQLFHD